MTTTKLTRWLLVALAIVGLAFAAPVVSAHGNDTAADDARTEEADEWTTWMEAQMIEQMGPGSVELMESHMGVTVDETAHNTAEKGHQDGDDNGGMYGQGHC